MPQLSRRTLTSWLIPTKDWCFAVLQAQNKVAVSSKAPHFDIPMVLGQLVDRNIGKTAFLSSIVRCFLEKQPSIPSVSLKEEVLLSRKI